MHPELQKAKPNAQVVDETPNTSIFLDSVKALSYVLLVNEAVLDGPKSR